MKKYFIILVLFLIVPNLSFAKQLSKSPFIPDSVQGEFNKLSTEHKVKFCGFENDSIVQKFKVSNTGSNDPYDLDKWQSYEEANPRTFASMYQFWCQKIG